MYSYKDLTIIIPSTVNNINAKFVNQINSYSLLGIKIIISITPNISINDVYKKGFESSIKIIKSEQKGQVKQRQYAYKFCKTCLIMHMDDDMLMSIRSLKKLIREFCSLKKNACLAPRIKNSNKVRNDFILQKIKNIILFLNFNPKPGSVSITSFPVQHQKEKGNYDDFQKVDWLPGGLLIIKKKDIILNNYYQFKGKAYCEDLIHSFHLQERGIDLYISNNCFCQSPLNPYKNQKPVNFFKFILNDFNARNYFRKLSNKPLILMVIVYIFLILNYLFFKLKNIFNFLYKVFKI